MNESQIVGTNAVTELQAVPFSGQCHIMDCIEAVEMALHDIGIVPCAAVQVIIARPIVAAEAESAPEGVVACPTDQHIIHEVPDQEIVARISLATNGIRGR